MDHHFAAGLPVDVILRVILMLVGKSTVTKADLEKTRREIIQQTQISDVVGGQIKTTGNGRLLTLDRTPALAKVTDSTQIGTANRWTYAITFVVVHANGTITDSTLTGTAYNVTEFNNPADGTGLHGNGVDNSAADWPAGMEIMPAPTGFIVMVYPVGGNWIFEHCNGVDGTC